VSNPGNGWHRQNLGGIAMFDRLIESETADLKPRSRYFVVSSIVVGLLFVSAVIFSIYAGEIGLGSDQFEVSMLIAPPETAATEPDPPRPQVNRTTTQTAAIAQRPTNTLRPDESPSDVPPISVIPSNVATRPNGLFKIGELRDVPPSEPADYQGSVPNGTGSGNIEPNSSGATRPSTAAPSDETQPPAAIKSKSLGVINGIAKFLPKPVYPPAAMAINVQGTVSVQVTIDENGKVVSAKAASGNPMLRDAAERAALQARFTPTLLSKVPVKVTGVIVYNFTRN
jgi:protein TonB